MARGGSVGMPAELGASGLGWWAKQPQQQMTITGFGVGGRRLRRRRGGATVRLGSRRRRLLLRRLVRWSTQLRWRMVVALLGSLKKVVMEMVAGGELAQAQHLALPFACKFPLPLV